MYFTGCDRLVLARKAVENYLPVGQYYVFGMMKGEMVEQVKERLLMAERLELRFE